MVSDPKVDAYIAKAAPFAQPILINLRAAIHAAVPGLEEAIKWGMPHFLYKGKNLAGISGFKAHCAFVIHGDGRQGDAMGQYGKIASLADIPGSTIIKARLGAAAARIDEAGTAIKPKAAPRTAKPELALNPEFAAALDASPAAKATFKSFAPSHRREYAEWVNDAKRDETRAKRIVQAIEWLAEGKKRNWKYENC
ncbi:MAG: YdeI/OmpD-associated family protein [Novosphingobium sp.]|uniref:YdeI/OmpD-associated family protein n=1 Tax=Novosphingobium sp. TaxID=1874826 RepID=UPI0032BAD2DE